MKKTELRAVSQIVSIVPVNVDGKLRLLKMVKEYLGLKPAQPVFWTAEDEILLSAGAISNHTLPVNRSGSLVLPLAILQRLGIDEPSLVGLAQRPDAVAVKVVAVEEVVRDKARLVDIESSTRIVRRVEAPPMPDAYIPRLQAEYADFKLLYSVKAFIKERKTFDAWKTRQILGCPEPDDEELRKTMVTQRLNTQDEDGSWDGSLFATARNLRELAELGVGKSHKSVKQAVTWLVNRSSSTWNPGMFFASDALVAEQAEVMEKRLAMKSGTRPRFRQIKKSEKDNVMSGDDLIYAPCGPRIMWPNGLTIEALLAVDFEDNERVQTTLETLTSQDWCECGYQNGSGTGTGRKPLTDKELDAFETRCQAQYRCGGLHDVNDLKQADMAHRTFAMRQVEVTPEDAQNGEKHFLLGMSNHIQGCEFITTRSLSRVRDPRARRFAEAHLWRFASTQYAEDGTFPSERYGTGFHQAGILQAVARYDHPVAKVILLRALPWIVKNQNADGSWGQDKRKDAETYAVVYALLSLGNLLPETMVRTL
jgi:hypothetical protein